MKKTMKFAVAGLVLALIFAAAPKASAQFGVKAGIYTSHFSDVKKDDFKLKDNVGFQAGVLYKMHVTPGFVVQPELLYVEKRATLVNPDAAGATYNRREMNLSYMQLPVSLQYGPNLVVARPFVQVVPYLSYAMGKSADVGNWRDINRVAGGIGLGAGVDVWKLQFNVRYNWDITKIGDGEKTDGTTREAMGQNWRASKGRAVEFSVAITF